MQLLITAFICVVTGAFTDLQIDVTRFTVDVTVNLVFTL